MKFEPMYKIYYKKGEDEWKRILDNRRYSESSIVLPIAIHEYNRRHTYTCLLYTSDAADE